MNQPGLPGFRSAFQQVKATADKNGETCFGVSDSTVEVPQERERRQDEYDETEPSSEGMCQERQQRRALNS